MKINSGFVLRTIAGESMLVPIGESSGRVNGIISLNPIGAVIWSALCEKCDREYALEKLLEEYEIDRETALADLNEFTARLIELGLITE